MDSKYLNNVNARTKKPKVVPISASKPKRKTNKSVATPHKKTVASDTTIQKFKSYYKELYENTNQEWKWWITNRFPLGYTWTQKPLRTRKIWMPKIRKDVVSTSISPTIDVVSRISNVLKISNSLGSNLSNVPSSSNSLADYTTHPVHYLNQGNVTIRRVYYVEGLNHNLFSVGQFCDADLEVAFRKSTCFVRDLQGNDLLTGNRGSDLYTISLQETTSSTPIYFMAKASPTQAWLWHRRLSHLNFDYITLLSKKDIVTGLPKLKYVKDQLCSSCEMSKAKRSSFKSKAVPSSKGRLNLLHIDFSDLAPQRQEMSVENVTSGLVPQGQNVSYYDNSNPVPPRQNVVPTAEKTDSSQQGLEFLFSPLLEEYYNPTHGQAEENNNDQAPNASF
ncbi:retrovirus-related pol polyprotein from transposon TNT 1-94 [Tanacetum coccineum]